MIVRWGLDRLPEALAEAGIERPFLIASDRWAGLDLPTGERWSEVPSDRIDDLVTRVAGADGLLAVGGGSAIDLAKAVSAATGLPVVSVPTTYSGSEWTPFFGIRDPDRRMRGGGAGAHPVGIVYDPELLLDLPRAESGGTALNALAHCAEALYVTGRNAEGDEHALTGARLIGESLPAVLENGHDAEARRKLLEGAMHGGAAMTAAGLGLGHAMAQALGGRFGLAHDAANALTLPPALRFNQPVAAAEIDRFGEALGSDDPAARVEELARLAGYERLRDLGVPEDELDEVAEATAVRAGAKANPRPASPAEIAELLRGIY
jgi:maleylacetate reductase